MRTGYHFDQISKSQGKDLNLVQEYPRNEILLNCP